MSNLTSHSRALRPALQAARFCNPLILNATFCTKGVPEQMRVTVGQRVEG